MAPRPVLRAQTSDGVWGWITTVDHKRIGKLYLFTSLFFFLVGGIEAGLIRAQLAGPNMRVLSAETYNQIFTMHGTTMIFLAVMPLAAAFFNFLVPLQIGARDVAFPRLNAFSYWIYLLGGIIITVPIFFRAAPDGGWFNYAPLSTKQSSPGINVDFWAVGVQILGLSTLAASINFITTILNLRAPGMNLMRMPQFTWNVLVVQFMVLLAFPVLTIAVQFLIFDRFFGTNFYTTAAGADPLLWQHLFWIFGHPEVYILILPAFGLTSEVVPVFSRKPLFGYPAMIYATILIGFFGFGVWAHHMFAAGMGPVADAAFSLTTMLIAIPTGVKIFNWISTMWGGSIRFTTAMLFAIGLVSSFTIGGISGVMHASPPADLQQTDTYFIVAHIHYVLFGGSMFGLFAGIYHYFPKMFGRLLDERLGKAHFWLALVGLHVTFFPMHFSGLLGMPRRIYTYDASQGYTGFNQIATAGYGFLFVSVLIFLYNAARSMRSGRVAGNDPWQAGTLEWSISSPPPDYNFAELPRVTSRYPLWDLTQPELTREVPHSTRGDERLGISVAAGMNGQEVAVTHPNPAISGREIAGAGMHEEPAVQRTAHELGILMPTPTIMPLVCAGGVAVMFCGLLVLERSTAAGVGVMVCGAVWWVSALYGWLTTPLERAA
ncbi:cytochrome c oxidase subunit I [Gemmatirosa kalamazoonensis]|uniref:cytochrome c oxidase subunit I n=1 Tax=Gemmatirosa kalamazoonensis TaxID=861299 RepID=UPI001F01B46F|nr:cytochrome c oxidase subunit I [Gemmatirosa kalamazoonensis]